MSGGPWISYVAEKLHFSLEEALPERASMTLEDIWNRQILAAGDVWRAPVWPLDPTEPRPPTATTSTPAIPTTSSTPPPPQPTTTRTHPSEAGPSRTVSTASISLRPRPTPPPPHTSASALPSSLEAKVDYLLTCVQLIGAHFSIPLPSFPTPVPPPSRVPSPISSPHPQSSPIPVPTRKGEEKIPEHSAAAEDEVDASFDQTLDWMDDPEWIASTGLTPGAQQARIDAGETSDGKDTQSEESAEEEEDDTAADQFVEVPHDISLSIVDIDRSAAIEGGDVELDEIVEDEAAADAEDEAEDEVADEDTVTEHAHEDASVASGSPAASS